MAETVGAAPLPAIRSREQAERALHRYSALTVAISSAVAKRDRRVASLNVKAALVIEPAQAEMAVIEARLQEWADAHRTEEFGESKALELQCGELSYRLGPRKVECRSGWTEQDCLSALLKFPVTSQWAEYIRREPQIDKAKILADTKAVNGHPGRLPESRLGEVGLKVTREERFSVAAKPNAVLAEAPCP